MYQISGNITGNVTGNLLVITGNGNTGNITSNFRTLLVELRANNRLEIDVLQGGGSLWSKISGRKGHPPPIMYVLFVGLAFCVHQCVYVCLIQPLASIYQ